MSSLIIQQPQAIKRLDNGDSHFQIAVALGIFTKTNQHWLEKPEFAQALTDVEIRER